MRGRGLLVLIGIMGIVVRVIGFGRSLLLWIGALSGLGRLRRLSIRDGCRLMALCLVYLVVVVIMRVLWYRMMAVIMRVWCLWLVGRLEWRRSIL